MVAVLPGASLVRVPEAAVCLVVAQVAALVGANGEGVVASSAVGMAVAERAVLLGEAGEQECLSAGMEGMRVAETTAV